MIVRVRIYTLVYIPVPHDVSHALTFKELYSNGSGYFKHLWVISSNFINDSNNYIVNHVIVKAEKIDKKPQLLFSEFQSCF